MVQIYVLESVVYSIQLEPSVNIQSTDGLLVNVKCSYLVNFDIDTQHFTEPQIEADSDGRNIAMNYGKTFLFISKPADLRQMLQLEPYIITLFDGAKTIGSAAFNWKREFSDMIKFFEMLGIVKSTASEELYELYNKNGKKAATVNMFIRMSCFGPNVQTTFQIRKTDGDADQQYIFRQRNVSTTFKVDRYFDDRNQPVVAPLFGLVTDPKSGQESLINMRETASLTQLFEREVPPKFSNYQGPDDGDTGINLDFGQDYDVVSICFRPSQNKFYDMLDVLTANVKASGTIQKSNVGRAESFLKSVGGSIKLTGIIIDDDDDEMIETTANQIAKKMCKNKECPATKKFKDYGIGPLATGNNLGTLYGDVEPQVTYGLSHTYGTMSGYGPYGVYASPNDEDPRIDTIEPIINKPVKPCKKRKIKGKVKKAQWHSQGCPLCPDRLRGGWDNGARQSSQSDSPSKPDYDEVKPKSPMVECKSVMDQFDNILAEYKRAIGPCGQATCPYAPSLAVDACKKACAQSDPLSKGASLQSCNDVPCDVNDCPYAGDPKKKRYPSGCGNSKCGYTKYKLGLVDEDAEMELQFLPPALAGNCGSPECKYPLAPPLPPIHWNCLDPLPKGPCRNLNCPFQPPPLKKFKTQKQLKTGPCGSPMCAYALPQPCQVPTCPFAMMPCPMNENQNQEAKKKKCPPSSEEEVCENPYCPFGKSEAEGDVPEEVDDLALQGEFQDCVNPGCPFKKSKRDKKKKSKNKRKEHACGSPMCAYALPQPCQVPTCPFAMMPCPMNENQNQEAKKKKCPPSSEEEVCENPYCPFGKTKAKGDVPEEMDDLAIQDCVNPDCPFKKTKRDKKKKSKNKKNEHACGNPECPFANPPKKDKKKKKNRKNKDSENTSICSSPDCPSNQNNKKEATSSSESVSICSDPDCPYAELKTLKKKRNGKGDAEDRSCDVAEGESLCSNPDCPARLERQEDDSLCPVPGCPYSKPPDKSSPCVDPKCPYLQPLPSCGIPNCPYEPIPVRFSCKNFKCPSHKVDFSRKRSRSKLGLPSDKANGNKEQPSKGQTAQDNKAGVLQTTTVCEDTVVCDPTDDCENPDCDMKPGDKNATKGNENNKESPKKKKKKKKTGKFVYSIGDNYPGTKLGHKECVLPVFNVPPHMGWLWNVFTPALRLKPRRGWRPGALTKTIASRIRAHRQAKGLGQVRIPNFKIDGTQDDGTDLKVVPKPTLQIQKKDGAYWITMNPLKDPFGLMNLNQINSICLAEEQSVEGRKPIAKLQSFPVGEPQKIFGAKPVTSRFGAHILLELENSVVFLPKRVTETFKPYITELNGGKFAIVFIGEKDVGQPKPLIQFKVIDA